MGMSDEIAAYEAYNGSELEFMNPYEQSSESYFGNNNGLKMSMIKGVQEIRDIYEAVLDSKEKTSVKKEMAKELQNAADSLAADIARECNIEKCYVGLFNGLNAFAIPMCWDSSLIVRDEEKKKLFYNISRRKSIEDIMETKNGFKFRDKKQKIFCLGLGLGFFDVQDQYTTEEVAAIMLHELGHSFQHMLTGVNENIASVVISSLMQQTNIMFDLLMNVFSFGTSFLIGLITNTEINQMKKADQDDLGEGIAADVFGSKSGQKEYDRDNFGDELNDMTKDTIKDVSKLERRKNSIGRIIGKFILGVIVGFCTMMYYLIKPIYSLIDLAPKAFRFGNKGWLNKNKRWEQFADHFAASYGLGPQISSALAKMGKEHYKINLHSLNWVNYIPVLNLVINYQHYSDINVGTLMSGYPNMKKRIVGVYQTLVFELKNNKELSASEKKEIQEQIDSMHSIYKDYVYGSGSRNFVYKIYHGVMRKKLENEKSDIKENVLEVMLELKEDKFVRDDESKAKAALAKHKNIDLEDTKFKSLTFIKKMSNILKMLPIFKNTNLDTSQMMKDLAKI